MPLWLVKWVNGDVSVIAAPNESRCDWLRDEEGSSCDVAVIEKLDEFAVHLEINLDHNPNDENDESEPFTYKTLNHELACKLEDSTFIEQLLMLKSELRPDS